MAKKHSWIKKENLIQAYKQRDLSLGQLSTALDLSYLETMQMLTSLEIAVIDYNLEDDLKTITKLQTKGNK